MKNRMHLAHGLPAASFLLMATLAIAQTMPQTKAGSAQGPSSHQTQGMAVDHPGGNGVRRAVSNPVATTQPAATTVAPAPAPTTRQKKHLAGVKYEDRNTGENPLFESKDKAKIAPATGTGSSHQ